MALPILRKFNFQLDDLPDIRHGFYVPPLADKPQNPIMDGLKYMNQRSVATVPLAVREVVEPPVLLGQTPSCKAWEEAAQIKVNNQNLIRSWDALRKTYDLRINATPFLSEQSPAIFASVQYHVQPILQDPIYVAHRDLMVSLRTTVLGTSSVLHTWDHVTETFSTRAGLVLLDGKNSTISKSFMNRFLTIGTILRRLDILITALHLESTSATPTTHAFAHALQSIVAYFREDLAGASFQTVACGTSMYSAISFQHVDCENTVMALAMLCGRGIGLSPQSYSEMKLNPATLLSLIYTHLNIHVERQSSRLIRASLAYILTATSDNYIQNVCQSIGLGTNVYSFKDIGRKTDKMLLNTDLFGEVTDQGEDHLDNDFHEVYADDFPVFFGDETSSALVTARRSLELLKAAQPDHPLLMSSDALSHQRRVWLWTEEDVAAGRACHRLIQLDEAGHHNLLDPILKPYHPDIAIQFNTFDLEPGSTQRTASSAARNFITTFPSSFPVLIPTLTQLRSLAFQPLLSHASNLSQSLLRLFLSPEAGTMNFITHLTVLRSYLLLTSQAFKSRLAIALFSDSAESDDLTLLDPRARARESTVDRVHGKGTNTQSEMGNEPWAVGLASVLTNREAWPPGGADLSFLLKTVIVDSLDMESGAREKEMFDFEREFTDSSETKIGPSRRRSNGVLEQAEYRLGFAIRDLPLGPGRDRWLDPTSIEALDFLYMDYTPPHPLHVLITPAILAKYQRVFAFILRLMRVEHVAKAIFRMSKNDSEPLFPTLISSNRLLLHFRFVAQSFVTALSAYVFDTAIGGIFDVFLAKLTSHTAYTRATEAKTDFYFSDVFALSDAHSAVLDTILSACLLRSSQKAVGDLLRATLEIILELGILAGELKTGRMQEYQAAPLLGGLYGSFRRKMCALIRVLKRLVEKHSSISRLELEAASRQTIEGDSQRAPGGVNSLYQLMIRLDIGDWWSGFPDK